MKRPLALVASVIFASIAVTANADVIAYTDPSGQGTQLLGINENLALNFSINSPITVTELGMFNASGSGTITAPTEVVIFNTATNTEVTPVVTFLGSYTPAGLGFDVFQAIAPVVLGPGSYEVDALWNGTVLNGNLNTGSSTGPILNSGGGALTFTGASYDASSVLDDPSTCGPLGPCQPPPAQFSQFDAGTFEFQPGAATAVPEPSPFLPLLAGLLTTAFLVRFRSSGIARNSLEK
jgi:hypothetical protein